MTAPNPNVAVHLEILFTAVCHSCGWESGLSADRFIVEVSADQHECETP